MGCRRWARHEGRLEAFLDEALADALDRVHADFDCGGNGGVEGTGLVGRSIGLEQDTGMRQLTGGRAAGGDQLAQFLALGSGQGDTEAFRSHAPSMPVAYHNSQECGDGLLGIAIAPPSHLDSRAFPPRKQRNRSSESSHFATQNIPFVK